MFCDDVLAVMVDIGHKKTAIGYIGDDTPRYATSSLAGTFHRAGGMNIEMEDGVSLDYNKSLFGENLTCRFKDVQYHNILEKETVKDFNQYKGFMGYLLDRLRVSKKECGLLVSECNSNQQDRDSIIQLAFEEFKVPAFFTAKKSILSLFASGRTTGLVLEAGANSTQIVPVSEGYILYKSLLSSPVGGETVTKNLVDYVEQNTGKELLPHFYYNYTFEQEGQRTATLKNIGHIDPSVLEFHKKRFVQELKELYLKVNTQSEDL